METKNKKSGLNTKKKRCLVPIIFMTFVLVHTSMMMTTQAYTMIQHPPYTTVAFSYSDALHDADHNQSMSEDEIYAMYEYIIASEYTWSALQNDSNKATTFLYLDIYGKDSNNNNPAHVIPAPAYFITEHFPSGQGTIPTNQKDDGSPFAYIMTDDYLEDLLEMIEEFYSELQSHDLSFAGFFLDDWYNVPAAWNDSMTSEARDLAWPGRGHTAAEQNEWWLNVQYPRMLQFESSLHELTVQYFGISTIIVNGPLRNFRTLPNGLKEPYYYGNISYTPDKTTIRCFEGPTVNTIPYCDFTEMLLPQSDPDYIEGRAFFPKDLLLMYSIQGGVGNPAVNGAYSDWINTGYPTYYDGDEDWETATTLANNNPTACVALAYGSAPATGGTRLSLFSNPLDWPYTRQDISDTTAPSILHHSPTGTISNTRPTITADLSDEGSGVNASKVYLMVDGINQTINATITPSHLSYTPTGALSDTAHTINITASDNDSNTGYLQWTFTVQFSTGGGNTGNGGGEEETSNDNELCSPIADAGGPYTGYANHSLVLNASRTNDANGRITNYTWDFGDNTRGWGVTPSHTYTRPGLYQVNLTVVDNTSLFGWNITWVTIEPSADDDPPLISDHDTMTNETIMNNDTAIDNGSSDTEVQKTPGFEAILVLFVAIVIVVKKRRNR